MDFIDYTPQTCQVCGLIDYRMFFGCRRCIANEYKDVTLTIKFHHNGDFEHWTFNGTMPINECLAMLRMQLKSEYDLELSALDEIYLNL